MLKIAWAPIYNHPLPAGHRFPMEKYELLPQQLVHEGVVGPESFFSPRKLTEEQILTVHERDYWEKLQRQDFTRQEERRSGFPISEALVEREVIINGGTLQCADFALSNGVSMNIAGGTHHAYSNRAEGFCLLNDIAIASAYLLNVRKLQKILVVDLDVHQGNGTAQIFENESRVFTFSMHGKNNYPLKKETSDLDVELPDGIEDENYLSLLNHHLDRLLAEVNPKFIFFQSGVDVLKTDKLGRLGLSIEGCLQRDQQVFGRASRSGIPIVAVMGGGYSPEIRTILEAHVNTFRAAKDAFF